MAIICRQCGQQNRDDAQFCTRTGCGAFLEWDGTRAHGLVAPIRATQEAGVQLSLQDRRLAVEPGSAVSTSVTVRNVGTRVEQFFVRIEGPAAQWATVDPPELAVYPGAEARCALRFAPPRDQRTAPGTAPFLVRAWSTVNPGLQAVAEGMLDVGEFRELTATLEPQQSRASTRTVHRVTLANGGNIGERIRLEAGDPESVVRFAPALLNLTAPVGRSAVDMAVRPPLRWWGQPRTHRFQVTIVPRAPLPPIRLDGSREVLPLIRKWMVVTTAAVALLGCLAGVAPTVAGQVRDLVDSAQDNQQADDPPPDAPASEQPPGQSAPPEPTVRVQGRLTIQQTFQADLDAGAVTRVGADLFFEAENENDRFLSPVGNAELAGLRRPARDAAQRLGQCKDANLSGDRIEVGELDEGDVLCVRTGRGRFSVVTVEAVPGRSPGELGIDFTTFEN